MALSMISFGIIGKCVRCVTYFAILAIIVLPALRNARRAGLRSRPPGDALGRNLHCGGSEFDSTFEPETASVAAMVSVTFSRSRPTAAVAETAVRKCLVFARRTRSVGAEIVGAAWWISAKAGGKPIAITFGDGSQVLVMTSATMAVEGRTRR